MESHLQKPNEHFLTAVRLTVSLSQGASGSLICSITTPPLCPSSILSGPPGPESGAGNRGLQTNLSA